MNWDAVAAIFGGLSFLGSIIVAVYFYGRMSRTTEVLAGIVSKHDTKIDNHEQRISHMEGAREQAAHGD